MRLICFKKWKQLKVPFMAFMISGNLILFHKPFKNSLLILNWLVDYQLQSNLLFFAPNLRKFSPIFTLKKKIIPSSALIFKRRQTLNRRIETEACERNLLMQSYYNATNPIVYLGDCMSGKFGFLHSKPRNIGFWWPLVFDFGSARLRCVVQ